MKDLEYEYFDHLFPTRSDSLSLTKETECSLCMEKGKGEEFNFIGKDIVWGNGKHDAEVMVIGRDSAGANPAERLWKASKCTFMPLTNKNTGAKFRIFLCKAKINPFSVFITNAVKCNNGYDKYEKATRYEKKKLFKSYSNVCKILLEKEIQLLKAKLKAIIILGDDIKELLNVKPIQEFSEYNWERSQLISGSLPFMGEFPSGFQAIIFCLYHPSRIDEGKYLTNLKIIANLIS